MASNWSFEFLVNHLILPPKLPQSREENLALAHDYLLKFIHEKAVEFERLCGGDDRRHWAIMVKMLEIWKETTQSGSVSPQILQRHLMSMQPNGMKVHDPTQDYSLKLSRPDCSIRRSSKCRFDLPEKLQWP